MAVDCRATTIALALSVISLWEDDFDLAAEVGHTTWIHEQQRHINTCKLTQTWRAAMCLSQSLAAPKTIPWIHPKLARLFWLRAQRLGGELTCKSMCGSICRPSARTPRQQLAITTCSKQFAATSADHLHAWSRHHWNMDDQPALAARWEGGRLDSNVNCNLRIFLWLKGDMIFNVPFGCGRQNEHNYVCGNSLEVVGATRLACWGNTTFKLSRSSCVTVALHTSGWDSPWQGRSRRSEPPQVNYISSTFAALRSHVDNGR